MRKLTLLVVFALTASSCALIGGSGGEVRTVLVDYNHDDFATTFLEYFPREVTLRPGDTVDFRQTWTGEAHSVTMGTLVDELFEFVEPTVQDIRARGFEAFPEDPDFDARVEELMKPLPPMAAESEEGFAIAQNGAQPCYLDEGTAPEDPDTPCAEEDQVQPPFNGRQSYYNSGFIPFEGPQGNKFTVELSEDMEPGAYFYYCNLHGPLMSGAINVVEKDSPIPSQEEVNRKALEEINRIIDPMTEEVRVAREGQLEPPEPLRELLLGPGQRYFSGNLAGLESQDPIAYHAGVLEFIPREITVKRGEPVTWTIVGPHTVTFDVPPYFPIVEVDEGGAVSYNEKIFPPAGGSPEIPMPSEEEEPDPLILIDGGEWDGGFFSSGLIESFGEPSLYQYRLRFSNPGTYRYACLIHPQMVGTVTVE